jgi:hypothetical protein
MDNEKDTNRKKKEVPFLEIFKQAAVIIWQNRFLLWFGVLVAFGSPGSFNYPGENNDFGKSGEAAKQFFETYWGIVLLIALVLLAIGVALFLVSLIGKAGLIRSVSKITQNKKITFRHGWREGKKYLGKLFGLSLLFFAVTLVIVLILGIPVVYLIINQSFISAALVGILAIAILIPLLFILAITNIFAQFYIILSDLKVWGAVEAGYNLLLKNIANSLIFGLLLMALTMLSMFILIPVVIIAFIIFVPAGLLFHGLSSIAFGIFLVFAILLFLALILFVSSIFQTYKITAWTLFFHEIAKVETPEAEKVVEEEIEKEIVATPEKA